MHATSNDTTYVDDANDDDVSTIHGIRVVELEVLAKALDYGCRTCGKPLHLSSHCEETIPDLGSFSYSEF